MFRFDNEYLNENLSLELLNSLYGTFDVNVREVDDNEDELLFNYKKIYLRNYLKIYF